MQAKMTIGIIIAMQRQLCQKTCGLC
jgi:hypothetical protein